MSDDVHLGEVSIRAEGVRKVFGSGPLAFEALKSVDFQARRGEFVILKGPSGSGKTTLLSILGCVLSATSGRVQLLDEVVTDLSERHVPELRLAYIGFIFQSHNLIASFDALANVMLPLELRGWTRKEARAEATALLERVGLEDKVRNRIDQLSGGQRQRVAVARAIAGSPPILLADEPTASLDAESGLNVTQLLKDLAREQGATVIVVTHDNRITHLADRIVSIEDGAIVGSESP
jgi:putative ABC transport system ATP-binding protein